MEKRALKILICLLVIPIIISIIIALTSGQNYGPSHEYKGNVVTEYNNSVKSSSGFVYLCVFIIVVSGVGVWIYVKKKGNV